MRYYNFYFSPTGGTKKVADTVAQAWGEGFTAVDLMKPTEPKAFTSQDLCLFAVPSYGGRVPAIVVERLKVLSGNGAKAILIVVFGNRAIDDTLLELSDVLQEAGFQCIAAMEAVAQHSLMQQYGAGRPDAEDIQELKRFAQEIKTDLENNTLSSQLALPGNRPYQKYGGVPLKPSASKGCIRCGACAEQCPVGAIPMTDFQTTNNQKCISCMRCVTICPEHVRKLNKMMVLAASQKMKKACSGRKNNKLYL